MAKYVLPNLKKSFFNDLEQFRLLTFILAMYVVEKYTLFQSDILFTYTL